MDIWSPHIALHAYFVDIGSGYLSIETSTIELIDKDAAPPAKLAPRLRALVPATAPDDATHPGCPAATPPTPEDTPHPGAPMP